MEQNRNKIRTLDIQYIGPPEAFHNPSLVIIVPYRERFEHLKQFLPHIQATIGAPVLIVEQGNDKRFNRGILLNIGFALSKECRRIVFHDVDTLPSSKLWPYYHSNQYEVLHLAAPEIFREEARDFFGGVTAFSSESFQSTNGFPNTFWGWGGEDIALAQRVARAGLTVYRPTTGNYISLEHPPAKDCARNTSMQQDLWRDIESSAHDGLNSLRFEIIKEQRLSHDARKITVTF